MWPRNCDSSDRIRVRESPKQCRSNYGFQPDARSWAIKSITRELRETPSRLALDAVRQFLICVLRSPESLTRFPAFSAGTSTSHLGSGRNTMSTSVKNAATRCFANQVPTPIPAITNSKRKLTTSAGSWAIASTSSGKTQRPLNTPADADTRSLKHNQHSR